MLESLLSARGVRVEGSAGKVEHADDELLDDEIDALIVDGAGESAEELLEELRESEWLRETMVVVLVEQASAAWTAQAMRAGVRGVLPAGVGGDLLVAALAAVGQGLAVLHPELTAAVRTSGASAEVEELNETLEALTSREKEVLRMLAEGLGNKQIAGRLQISEHTAKFHVASIFGKLGVSTRAEAVAMGMRRGLILL